LQQITYILLYNFLSPVKKNAKSGEHPFPTYPFPGIDVKVFLYSIPPWRRVIVEKLIVAQLINKFPAFYVQNSLPLTLPEAS
jgi:hypothetical protein